MGWDGWMESYPSDCLDYLSICGETYSRHESSILSCLILTKERCHQWLPSKTIGTKEKKKFASPLLSRHCCINFLSSDDLILHRHDAPLLMRLPTTFCQKQTASNISCFVSHIQIKKLWRISYASKNFSFHVAIRIFVLSKKYLLFWANIRE